MQIIAKGKVYVRKIPEKGIKGELVQYLRFVRELKPFFHNSRRLFRCKIEKEQLSHGSIEPAYMILCCRNMITPINRSQKRILILL